MFCAGRGSVNIGIDFVQIPGIAVSRGCFVFIDQKVFRMSDRASPVGKSGLHDLLPIIGCVRVEPCSELAQIALAHRGACLFPDLPECGHKD